MKCSKHREKDAVAVCEKCNISCCGDCALSSNGRCPSCGKALSSPEAVPLYTSPEEMYGRQDAPSPQEAINSLYLEPVRTIRRLMPAASLFTGVINISIVYVMITLVRVALAFAALVLVPPVTSGGTGLQSASAGISRLLSASFIVDFLVSAFLWYGVFVISWLVQSLILFAPAKLLRGKSTFAQQACLLSYAMLAVLPIAVFSLALVVIPYGIGSTLAFLGAVVALVYTLLLTILIIKETNEFSKFTAVLSFFISFSITILLCAIIGSIIFLNAVIDAVGKLVPLSI